MNNNTNKDIDEGYFENKRPEIIELIEKESKLILDVGCGKGYLGRELKNIYPQCKVIGIEYNDEIAKQAKLNIDDVYVGDVQNMNLNLDKSTLDAIIFADILEHIIDPSSVLIRLKQYLKNGGYIIASIPNMRHYTVIMRLIKRGWMYDEYGHFDKTHIRFFSLHSMIQLIKDAGYMIELIKPRIVASKKMKILNFMLFDRLQEFIAFQYIIKARNVIR